MPTRWNTNAHKDTGPDMAMFQSWLRDRITRIDPDHPVDRSYQCHMPPPETSSPD